MKCAITADVHLTGKTENPERYHALQNILSQMREDKLDTLIIAGDLFHADARSFAEFEALCNHPDYRHIALHNIPGNHDARLDRRSFAIDNVHVYSEATWHRFHENDSAILFLPYMKDISMGEALAPWQEKVKNQQWTLVAHGDWIDSMREPNSTEPGVYMPLLRTDLENFKPVQIFLGHIHKPLDKGILHIPGSPCSLDITETGKRRYLIFNSTDNTVTSRPVQTDFIYFNESLVILPVENQRAYIQDKVTAMMQKWAVSESDRQRIKLRLRLFGYTASREELKKVLMEALNEIAFYADEPPDFSAVSVADDVDRAAIAAQVDQQLQTMSVFQNPEEPTRQQAFLQALKTIYEAE